MRHTCLKATDPLRRDSSLFTIQFPGVPGTQPIDFGRMKDWMDLWASQWFWNREPIRQYPANIYLFKPNNRSSRKMWDICSKLAIKAAERRHWRFYCWLWTYFTPFSSVSIVEFQQVNVNWVWYLWGRIGVTGWDENHMTFNPSVVWIILPNNNRWK